MISVLNLSKRYGYQWALQNVSLQVKPKEIVALLGPNAAGKSTLLRCIATLVHPMAGKIKIGNFGFPESAISGRALIGYVGHQPLLYEDLTADENLSFFGRLYGVANINARVAQLLDMFDLVYRRREPVRNFSRGLQQRLAIARALLHKPKFLLLDEPYNALDRKSASLLDGILKQEAKRGAAILFTTHDMGRAMDIATRIDLLTRGKLVGSITKSRFNLKSATAYYDKAMRSASATSS